MILHPGTFFLAAYLSVAVYRFILNSFRPGFSHSDDTVVGHRNHIITSFYINTRRCIRTFRERKNTSRYFAYYKLMLGCLPGAQWAPGDEGLRARSPGARPEGRGACTAAADPAGLRRWEH